MNVLLTLLLIFSNLLIAVLPVPLSAAPEQVDISAEVAAPNPSSSGIGGSSGDAGVGGIPPSISNETPTVIAAPKTIPVKIFDAVPTFFKALVEKPPLFDVISEPFQSTRENILPFVVFLISAEILLILLVIFIVRRIRGIWSQWRK